MMSDLPAAVSTVRFDPALTEYEHNASIPSPIYLLDGHYKRLQNTLDSLHLQSSPARPQEPVWDSPLDFHNTILQAVTQWQINTGSGDWKALRIRVSVDVDSKSDIIITFADHLPLSRLFPKRLALDSEFKENSTTFTIVLDDRSTVPSYNTRFKTTERTTYDDARRRANIPSYTATKEVLLYNEHGEIMDGSITTPYFWRDGEWVTPSSQSGGIQGVTRSMILDRCLCKEAVVLKDKVRPGEVVWLSNAVKGFFWGIVHIDPESSQDGPKA